MSVFILETDSLMSASSSLQSLGSQVSNLVSSVEGYDVSCEDGFDFAGAKEAIAGNLDACTIKIQNTACVLENVCDSHTQLQQSLQFGGSGGSSGGSGGSSGGSGGSSGSSGGSSGGSGGSSGGSGGSSGGSGGSSGGSGGSSGGSGGSSRGSGGSSGGSGSSSGGASNLENSGQSSVTKTSSNGSSSSSSSGSSKEDIVSGSVGVGAAGVGASYISRDNENNNTVEQKASKEKSEVSVIDNNFERVGMAAVIETKLSSVSKDFFSSNQVSSGDGLMMTDNKYVISCDSSIGKVGDVIQFTQNDGSVIECVVGVETRDSKYKNVVNFLISDRNDITQVNKDLCNSILENNSKIEKIN